MFDRDSDQATSLGKFCGSSIPVIPPSTSHVVMLRLVTDDSTTKQGFVGRFQEQWGVYHCIKSLHHVTNKAPTIS